MPKRMLAFFLSLLAALSLAACAAPASDAPAAATPEPGPAVPYERQRQTLESLRSVWDGTDSYYADWFYVFTDLDGNGRMEVVTASLQGSGLFTYAAAWELSEDCASLTPCETFPEYAEGPDAWPDLIQDSLPCYTDPDTGLRFYVCEDITRDGAAHYYMGLCSICLSDGKIERSTLGAKEILYTDPELPPAVVCTDAQGAEISEEEYENLSAQIFARCQRSELALEWTRVEFSWPDEDAEALPAA